MAVEKPVESVKNSLFMRFSFSTAFNNKNFSCRIPVESLEKAKTKPGYKL